MSSQLSQPGEIEVSSALRKGLADVPVRRPDPAFDEAILAAVERPSFSWPLVRARLRAVLVGGTCSAALAVVLLQAFLRMPDTQPQVPPTDAHAAVAIDRLLDQPDLRGSSLMGATIARYGQVAPERAPVPTPRSTPAPAQRPHLPPGSRGSLAPAGDLPSQPDRRRRAVLDSPPRLSSTA